MSAKYYGLLFAILSPLASSIATIFKAGAAKALSPLPVVGLGGALGSLILFSLAKIREEKITLHAIKLNKNDLILIILLRFLLGELFFTSGLAQTSAIKAIFFTKIEPYFVLFLGWLLLKERVQFKHLALLSIHLVGAILLSTGGNFGIVGNAQIGDLFIIMAMAFFASSYIYGKRLAHTIGPISSNAVSMGIGSIIVIPFMLVLSPMANLAFPSQGWLYLLLYVVLFNVIALTLWFATLKTVKGWMASALRYIGPVLGAPLAFLLFGETLNSTQLLGAAIILTTSFLIAKEHLREAT